MTASKTETKDAVPPEAKPAAKEADAERNALWIKAGLGAAAIGSAAVAAALLYTRNTKAKKKN